MRKKSIAMIHSEASVWPPGETAINNSDKDEVGQESRKVPTLFLEGYILDVLLDKNLKASLVRKAEPLHLPLNGNLSGKRGPCS